MCSCSLPAGVAVSIASRREWNATCRCSSWPRGSDGIVRKPRNNRTHGARRALAGRSLRENGARNSVDGAR